MKMNNLSQTETDAIVGTSPIGIMTLDDSGRVQWINQTLANMLEMNAADLLGCDSDNLPNEQLKILFSDTPTLLIRNENQDTVLLTHSVVSPSLGGTKINEVHYFVDNTELNQLRQENQELREQLEHLHLNDPKTGLLSQRALMLVLEPQVSQSRRYNNPLSLIIMDVVGQESGSSADDEETHLRAIAQTLKDQLRWADLIARDQTGRFVMVLPETESPSAHALVEKINRALPRNEQVKQYRFGISEWKLGDNASGLLRRASQSLEQPPVENQDAVTC